MYLIHEMISPTVGPGSQMSQGCIQSSSHVLNTLHHFNSKCLNNTLYQFNTKPPTGNVKFLIFFNNGARLAIHHINTISYFYFFVVDVFHIFYLIAQCNRSQVDNLSSNLCWNKLVKVSILFI